MFLSCSRVDERRCSLGGATRTESEEKRYLQRTKKDFCEAMRWRQGAWGERLTPLIPTGSSAISSCCEASTDRRSQSGICRLYRWRDRRNLRHPVLRASSLSSHRESGVSGWFTATALRAAISPLRRDWH